MELIFPKIEKEILEFWREKKIFERSIKQRSPKKTWTFYDGPPFATGLPHYGNILAMTIKDAVTRYWAMKGYYIPRRAGWDCHGLPVEYEVEKELGVSGKRDIENRVGIEYFNERCRGVVLRYVKEWEKTMERLGRWIDFKNAYRTMDREYMESIWWVFKQLWDKQLIYRDYRSVSYCPRCATPLSNFEVNQGYRDNVEDPSVYIKFQVTNPKCQNTYFLAWTTTPWTLPGNTALAVNPEAVYVKIRIKNNDYLILAEARLSEIKEEFEIVEKYQGKDFVGWQYQPLYNFVKPEGLAWQVVDGRELVSLDQGTGIVHIAPSYGEEDFWLGKKLGLAFISTIDESGKMIDKTPWRGVFIKDADKLIINDLKDRGLMYRSEKIFHTYPFCWRCESPVYDYLWPAWFVAVTKIKENMIKNNQLIYWVPEHLKNGRFGKWLEGARDWNISRNRYWGTPIPVWICQKCKNMTAVGSLDELAEKSLTGNLLIIVRHGEAETNVNKICNGDPVKVYHLTKRGRQGIKKLAKTVKKFKADLIISSDFLRTKETAEILQQLLKIPVLYDSRLRERQFGVFEGRQYHELERFHVQANDVFKVKPPAGESFAEAEKRVGELLTEINNNYQGKKILLVTHEDIIRVIYTYFHLLARDGILEFRVSPGSFVSFHTATCDLHRPYIDQIKIKCQKCGGVMERTPEVLDCWFESGSMPYAERHFPFENKKTFLKNFPADFIAEGLDQTRGWFYTLHVLATALFHKPAFKNVIVNGLVLAEDGRKMSKRLKNYPEPEEVFESLGVDALRFYLLSSPVLRGEDIRFSLSSVAEKVKKVLLPLWNIYQFFEMYAQSDLDLEIKPQQSKNLLDQWVLSSLEELIQAVTKRVDQFDLVNATLLIEKFITEISTWYLRRSRERFKSETGNDKKVASSVLFNTLFKLLVIAAPFTPFLAEYLYQKLLPLLKKQKGRFPDSIHLVDWPKANKKMVNQTLLQEMEAVRLICELGHALRAEAKIKVRQALSLFEIQGKGFRFKELISLIQDELNVKGVKFVQELSSGQDWLQKNNETFQVALNIKITPELRIEGILREIIHQINLTRREVGFLPKDRAVVYYQTSSAEIRGILENFENKVLQNTSSEKLIFVESINIPQIKAIKIDGQKLVIGLKKI
jgi:isoleucyl-tRNA synthetase